MGRQVFLCLICVLIEYVLSQSAPNIIYMLTDNPGWNDVSFHGSNIYPTPNIDALAYSGVILNSHYAQPSCTASRSALLTSRYPYKTGTNSIIRPASDIGVPLNETLMPEYLRASGYSTNLVGKWHLGSATQYYTPSYRGFDSFFGTWNGMLDYWKHDFFDNITKWTGYDVRRDMETYWDRRGEYLTRVQGDEAVSVIQNHNMTKPLFLMMSFTAVHASPTPGYTWQAPQETIDRFDYIEDQIKRNYSAMFYEADIVVGRIFEALDQRQMLDNSIIVFSSDNGAAYPGSNWPLRGAPDFEGGIRMPAFIWSPLIDNPGRVSNQMIHLVDWMPTFLSAAGVESLPTGIDGINLWPSIVDGSPSLRNETLHDIHMASNTSILRVGDWKILNSQFLNERSGDWESISAGLNSSAPEQSPEYIMESMLNSTAAQIILARVPNAYDNAEELRENATVLCGPVPPDATPWQQCSEGLCLFNIVEDPCEFYDQSTAEPIIYQQLKDRLQEYLDLAVDQLMNTVNEEANPDYWNGTWNNWMDYLPPINRATDL